MSLNHHATAIRLLANGFADEFANVCAGNEKIHEIMMELASEFVEQNIPIVDEDAANDVAVELLMGVTCRPV